MLSEGNFRDYFIKNRWVFWFFGIGLSVILLRVGYLQIVKGDKLHDFSQKNRIRKERVTALRGLIYDRKGLILADYRFRFDLVVVPQFIEDTERLFLFLSQILDRPTEELFRLYRKKKAGRPEFQPVVIASNVTQEMVAMVEVQKKFYAGLEVRMVPTRHYTDGHVFSNVVGYVSELTADEIRRGSEKGLMVGLGDLRGRRGVERLSDDKLRGKPGIAYIHVDAHGRRIENRAMVSSFRKWIKPRFAVQGLNVKTTVDSVIQNALFEAFGDFSGAGVVLEARTGKVRAMVSRPGYDSNTISEEWSKLISGKGHPLLNKAIQGVYPPGSVLKVIVALAGLHSKVVRSTFKVDCSGHYRLGRRVFHCWRKKGHGVLSLRNAIVQSCDVYFYRLGQMMGVDRLAETMRQFGFGRRTGLGLLRERSGLVPTKAWKKETLKKPWVAGETMSVSIGQGYVGVTPLQVATAVAAIVNGGKVLRPTLLESLANNNGREIWRSRPIVVRDLEIDPSHLALVKQAMVAVMQEPGGTGYSRRSAFIEMGGKTGTAQVRSFSKTRLFERCDQLPFENRHHAWFVGFWPVQEPRLVAAVIREHGCAGSRGALPIVRHVFEVAAQAHRQEETVAQDK